MPFVFTNKTPSISPINIVQNQEASEGTGKTWAKPNNTEEPITPATLPYSFDRIEIRYPLKTTSSEMATRGRVRKTPLRNARLLSALGGGSQPKIKPKENTNAKPQASPTGKFLFQPAIVRPISCGFLFITFRFQINTKIK